MHRLPFAWRVVTSVGRQVLRLVIVERRVAKATVDH